MKLPARSPLLSVSEPAFDWLARRVAQLLTTPMGLVSLVTVEGQVWPGAYGLPKPWNTERATPLSHSFCQHVVTTERLFLVMNAHDNPLVSENDAVIDLGVVAYAGAPIALHGRTVGALGAADHRPRDWADDEVADLLQLADLCSTVLDRRIPLSA